MTDGRAAANRARSTHGMAPRGQPLPPEYNVWSRMKDRCNNPKNKNYADYGGRGVKVCDRWQTDFSAFLADVGRRPSSELTLERIENDGNYEPGNVRWATRKEQKANQRPRKDAITITVNGNAYLLHVAAKTFGINYQTLYHRVKSQKLSGDEAIHP